MRSMRRKIHGETEQRLAGERGDGNETAKAAFGEEEERLMYERYTGRSWREYGYQQI